MTDRRRHSILYVGPSMRRGGAERQALSLLLGLRARGWETTLVTMNERGAFFDAAEQAGLEAVCLEARGNFPLRASRRLLRLLRERRPDVVLTTGFNATTVGRAAAIVAGVPVIAVAEHSTGTLGRPLWKSAVDSTLSLRTDAYIAVSESQREYLRSLGVPSDRTTVIYNGIECVSASSSHEAARAALGIPVDAFVVGIVAAMRPEKDHRGFLEAAARATAIRSDMWFVIVGDGPARAELEGYANDLGVAERTVFTGEVADVFAVLPALDVFTLSSFTIETFPMSALEAMCAGVPVVATDVGGLREMVREHVDGELVPARDPAALAEAWVRLAADPEVRARMGSSARERVRASFNVEQMVDAHANLFETLLRGKEVDS